jgi:hypothetical protein
VLECIGPSQTNSPTLEHHARSGTYPPGHAINAGGQDPGSDRDLDRIKILREDCVKKTVGVNSDISSSVLPQAPKAMTTMEGV